MNEQVITQIAQIIGSTGALITDEYVRWYFIKAMIWVLISAGVIVATVRLAFPEDWEWPKVAKFWVRASIISLMTFIGACHLPDVFSPRAMAIHQLLEDLHK